jgi:exopolysaccharide biosynthesis polyprenyl glycosylphosphotransferase
MDGAHSVSLTTDTVAEVRARDVGEPAPAAIPSYVGIPERSHAHGSRTAKIAVVAADAAAIAAAMALAAWIRWIANDNEAFGPLWVTAILAMPIWLGVFARYKLYTAAAVTSRTAEFGRIVHGVAAASAATGVLALLIGADISRAWLVLTFVFALVTVATERSIVRLVFRQARARGQLRRRVVVIGANAEALEVVRMLRTNAALGYDVVGIVECGAAYGVVSPVPVLGDWSDTVDIVRSVDVSGVIVATSAVDIAVANRLARDLMELGYHVELTSGLVDISADRLIARPLGRRPVMYVEPVRLTGWRAVAKRGFDIAASAAMLFVLMPVLAVAAILIKLDSRGPVFFGQVRVGKNGKLFRVRKLRTMVSGAEQMLDELRDRNEADGALFKMADDPRITRVGANLRKWSIDELPQLWNVLLGEMSLVGPRPALPSEMSSWSDGLESRLRVKPGITGMWQVNGRSSASFDDYVQHDLYYVDNWSLLTDVAIVVKTIPVVLLHKGAY